MVRSIPHRVVSWSRPRNVGLTAGFILVAGLLLVAACRPDEEAGGDRPRRGGEGATLVACLQNLPQALNPFVSPEQESLDLAPLLFTTLVTYGDQAADRDFHPALALEWEWAPDQRSVRFRLRNDLRWHDGEPVTGEDVRWTLEAASDPAFTYWNAADFATLSGVDVEPDGAVHVRFAEPYGPGLEPFAILPVLPRHLLATVDPESFQQAGYHRHPVGSGPFILLGRTGGQIMYARNPDYPEDLGVPALARIVVKEVPEVATALVELRTGATDLCLMGPRAAREAMSVPDLQVLPSARGSTQVLLLDHRSPYFERAEVRRAISAAIDRSSVAAVVSPLATPARTFLPPSWTLSGDSLLAPDAAPALADSLLRLAGWAPAQRGERLQDPDGTPFEFPILAPQGFEQVLTVLQSQLARSGIRANPRVLEGSTFVDIILDPERRPPAMVIGLSPSRIYYPDPRSSLHSDGGTNVGSYRSPATDSLIEALARTGAPEVRDSLYRALQARVASDVPLVHLLHLPEVVIAGPRVRGVTAGPAGVFASAPRWSLVLD